MQHNRFQAIAGEWLRRAGSNLILAKLQKPEGVYWEDLCFDAQQAAEKALKAVCIVKNIHFPLTHDIGELIELLISQNIRIPEEFNAYRFLTEYSVTTRYPGWGSEVNQSEANTAVKAAEEILEWAKKTVTEA